jgi:hypothetical protein
VKAFKPGWDSRNIFPEAEKRTTETTTTSPVASFGGSGGATEGNDQPETVLANRRCVSCGTLLSPADGANRDRCVRCEQIERGELAIWCIACGHNVAVGSTCVCDACALDNEFLRTLAELPLTGHR